MPKRNSASRMAESFRTSDVVSLPRMSQFPEGFRGHSSDIADLDNGDLASTAGASKPPCEGLETGGAVGNDGEGAFQGDAGAAERALIKQAANQGDPVGNAARRRKFR